MDYLEHHFRQIHFLFLIEYHLVFCLIIFSSKLFKSHFFIFFLVQISFLNDEGYLVKDLKSTIGEVFLKNVKKIVELSLGFSEKGDFFNEMVIQWQPLNVITLGQSN